jgi:hypothetical protein
MSPRDRDAARHCGKSWLHRKHRSKAIKNFSRAVDENSSDGFTLVGNEADLVQETLARPAFRAARCLIKGL